MITGQENSFQQQPAEDLTHPLSDPPPPPRRRRRRPLTHSRSSLYEQHDILLDEEEHVLNRHGKNSWQLKVFVFFHRYEVILTGAALMVLDICLILVDLILGVVYPPCVLIQPRCLCLGEGAGTSEHELGNSTRNRHECQRDCQAIPISVTHAQFALTASSIVVLCLFLVEVLALLIILGFKEFVKNLFLVFDLVIVLVAIGLEAFVLFLEVSHHQQDERSASELLAITLPLIVLSRFWRFLRLGHGAYKEAHEFHQEETLQLHLQIQRLQQEMKALTNPSD